MLILNRTVVANAVNASVVCLADARVYFVILVKATQCASTTGCALQTASTATPVVGGDEYHPFLAVSVFTGVNSLE